MWTSSSEPALNGDSRSESGQASGKWIADFTPSPRRFARKQQGVRASSERRRNLIIFVGAARLGSSAELSLPSGSGTFTLLASTLERTTVLSGEDASRGQHGCARMICTSRDGLGKL